MSTVRDHPIGAVEAGRAVGRRNPRKEDDRLLRGEGAYTGDTDSAHLAEMAVGRCPFPHARIVGIDAQPALEIPGVYGVLTGADVAARSGSIGLLRHDFGAPELPCFGLASERATYEGQGVVSVVAASRHLAEDALEQIEIDYEPLPHVSDIASALAPDAPVVYPELMSSNLLVTSEHGRGNVNARFQESDVVIAADYRIGRVSALPMETRAVVARWSAGAHELTLHVSTQVPHVVRRQLAMLLGLPDGAVRVVSVDVGGGFGLKLGVYPEDIVAALHAMDLGVPVRWVEDRNEHFRASSHARESVHSYRIGARSDGRILAMEDVYTNDLGAVNFAFGSSQQATIVFSGPYKVEDGRVERRVVVTNKTPANAYRGFGQPEANFAYERSIDRLARTLGMDPVELRVLNMVPSDELPWVNPVGSVYDSGDYERSLRLAAAAVDYDAHRSRPRRMPDGRYKGIGIASYVERTGVGGRESPNDKPVSEPLFGPHESVTLRANWSGGLDLYTGVASFGQGSETVFAQMASECTGMDYERITVHAGDTGSSPINTGGFASRTVVAAAAAIEIAGRGFSAKVRRLAAFALDIEDPEDLVIDGGDVRSIDRQEVRIPLQDVFRRAILGRGIPPDEDPGLEETSHAASPSPAYAFGSSAVELAVDPQTGEFEIMRLVFVHDAGVPINPTLVEGQVRGGIVQALGAAVSEELCYDAETGQLVNGTMMDYFAPLASDVPTIDLISTEVPSPVTPLGVRGAGESGTIPVGAAIANAICDALVDLGVEIDELPITPERVWKAICTAGGG